MAQDLESKASVPPFHQFMWPTIQALRSLGNSGSNHEINDKVIEITGLSEEQLRVPLGDGPSMMVPNRLNWARTDLKRAGAIVNSQRGIWTITEYGQTLTEADMARVVVEARGNVGVKRQSLANESYVSENVSGDEHAESTLTDELTGTRDSTLTTTGTEEWHEFLLEALLELPPATFEKLCQRMLRESGFVKVDVTGKTGDGGIDGIGVLRVSLLSFQVFFQCKRYRGSVGASAIRDFRGAMVGRTDKGLFITTGTFTTDAKREATRDGAPALDLIDGDELCLLLKDLKLGVTTELVEEVTVDAEWFRTL
jgi:restriction system protein